MARCLFLGDEVSAVGYRLAGVHALTPSSVEAEQILRRPEPDVGLIIMTAALASAVPKALLGRLRREQTPAFVVVADARGLERPRDTTASLKRQLGLAE